MPARTPQGFLDDLVRQQGKGRKMRRKLVVNKQRNWLLGIALNAFSSLSANEALTDIEQIIVEAFKENGFNDEELKERGRLFLEMPESVKRDIFPGKFARLTPQTKYTIADLKDDLPDIEQNILTQPNAVDIDVSGIHAGTRSEAEFPMPSLDTTREFAGSIFRAVEANRTPPNPTYTIKAQQFRCNDETGTDFLGSDEPYWIFGSLGQGIAITTRAGPFGDVDSGETRNFGASDGCIWGQDCAPRDFPDGEIGTHIQLWEHDTGDPEEARAAVAAAFAAAAAILVATGVAAWIGAIVAGVGAVVQWLLGFLDDDHIADQTFVFTRQSVVDQLTKAGQSFNVTRRFTDGDGDYTLTIQVARVA